MLTKKLFTLFIILVIGITPFLSCISGSSAVSVKSQNLEQKKWTWMVYSSADANNTGGVGETFGYFTSSNENINVIILEDLEDDTAKMWFVEADHSLTLLEDLGEISMGNYTTLSNFIDFCKNNYSANRYMLFLYGHGAGWLGALRDHGAGYRDDLTMDEMQKAFELAGNVDIICFSGPCLMGAIESAYELRNFTDVYIGSQTLSFFGPWYGDPIINLFNLIDQQNNLTNIYIGQKIIEYIKENVKNMKLFDGAISAVSAIQTNKLDNLSISIDALAKNLIENIDSYRLRLRLVRFLTRSFTSDLPWLGENHTFKMSTIDIYDFAKKCSRAFFLNKNIRILSRETMECLEDAVIGKYNGILQTRVNGLSIYFPRFNSQYNNKYSTEGLDFINDTLWDEFLESYLLN